MYRLFFNLAQCLSFLGVIIALIKDKLNDEILFISSCFVGSLILLLITLMIFTYKKDGK